MIGIIWLHEKSHPRRYAISPDLAASNKLLKDVEHPAPLHAVFADNDLLLLAGRYYTEKLAFSAAATSIFSSAMALSARIETLSPSISAKPSTG